MDSYRKCLAIANRYGLLMSVEGFPYSMISTPHAMLQLLKDVDDPDFGIQLDTNHLIIQHIDPEWTIYMLGDKRINNVQWKDRDAVCRNNIPAGCGITDYPPAATTSRRWIISSFALRPNTELASGGTQGVSPLIRARRRIKIMFFWKRSRSNEAV